MVFAKIPILVSIFLPPEGTLSRREGVFSREEEEGGDVPWIFSLREERRSRGEGSPVFDSPSGESGYSGETSWLGSVIGGYATDDGEWSGCE